MNAGIIFLIIFIILLVLAGLGVGLYFLLRKKTTPEGGGGGGGGGATGSTGSTGPTGSTGATGIVPGNFSIQSVFDPNSYITIQNRGQIVPSVIVLSSTSTPCINYSWQNIANFNLGGINSNAPSALIFNGTDPTLPPGSNVVSNKSGNPPFEVIVNQGLGNDSSLIQSWNYNKTNKTWCGDGNNSTFCLYHNTNNTVVATTFNATDSRFQWNNVSPLISPNCS
jgi:hypothetical protein